MIYFWTKSATVKNIDIEHWIQCYIPGFDIINSNIHKNLLKKIYSDKSLSDCDELFSHFPESGERSGDLYTKPYIFESLWKIIFLLGLDNKLAPGMERKFEKSLEKKTPITIYEYLSSETDGKIN